MPDNGLGKDRLLDMYRTMQTIRQFESRVKEIFQEGRFPASCTSRSARKRRRPAWPRP